MGNIRCLNIGIKEKTNKLKINKGKYYGTQGFYKGQFNGDLFGD